MAAFFHDIGHLLAFEEQETKSMGGFGVMHHEGLGEKLLIECGVPGMLCCYRELLIVMIFQHRFQNWLEIILMQNDIIFTKIPAIMIVCLKVAKGPLHIRILFSKSH